MKRAVIVMGVWLALFFPVSAGASPITFSFAGAVSQLPNFDPNDPFSGTIAFGTSFLGSYTFDSAAADGDPALNSGSYSVTSGSPYGLTVTIGGNTFFASNFLNIGVANDFAGPVDIYTVLAQKTVGADTFDIELLLEDFQASVFSNALLPLDAPPFTSFELATFSLMGFIGGNQVEILGQLNSLRCVAGCVTSGGPTVPEPNSGLLVFSGLAGLVLMRRWLRRSRPFGGRS